MRGTLAWNQTVRFSFQLGTSCSEAMRFLTSKHLLALYLLSGSTLRGFLLWTDLIPIWLGGFVWFLFSRMSWQRMI
jgi:hypothetical protein